MNLHLKILRYQIGSSGIQSCVGQVATPMATHVVYSTQARHHVLHSTGTLITSDGVLGHVEMSLSLGEDISATYERMRKRNRSLLSATILVLSIRLLTTFRDIGERMVSSCRNEVVSVGL